ncbi:MAG TPA: small ribosomal subunit Rsm22 family protein [Bacillota bacterium]
MNRMEQDLQGWIPRLVAEWRRMAGIRGAGLPTARLTRNETDQVGTALLRLQRGLTGSRTLIGGGYMNDPGSLGAYLLYYWPVSYLQTRYALVESGMHPRKLLDLGSGPGAATLACIDAGAVTALAADRSRDALGVAGRLARAGGVKIETTSWNGESGAPLPPGSYDCIILGHVLNELWVERSDRIERRLALLERISGHLGPAGRILILEPALLATSRELLHLRDRLMERGFQILAPCLFPGPCPAFAAGSDSTCHSEWAWELPPLVRDLARAARLDRHSCKTTYLVISRSTPSGAGLAGVFRVVSDPMLNQAGRTRYMICGLEGRFSLSAKPGEAGSAERSFFSLKRGDLIRVAHTETRGSGRGVTPETVLEVLKPGSKGKVK